jgi:hypothetical protein
MSAGPATRLNEPSLFLAALNFAVGRRARLVAAPSTRFRRVIMAFSLRHDCSYSMMLAENGYSFQLL